MNTNDADKTKGIYQKFRIERTDGSSAPGGKHENCRYFVLDLDHDPHALEAIRAYAQSCKYQCPALACDLLDIAWALSTPEGREVCKMDKTYGVESNTQGLTSKAKRLPQEVADGD